MGEAPERIWAGHMGEWTDEPMPPIGEVEYIRADLIEAAVKRALEGAAECCDVAAQDGIGDMIRAKGDEIRQLDPAQFVNGAK